MNAKIQEGHHSSIIDSRATLALFLRLKGVYALDIDGPMFLGSTSTFESAGRRRKKKNPDSFSKVVNRLAFKSLEDVENQDPNQFEYNKEVLVQEPSFNPIELEV